MMSHEKQVKECCIRTYRNFIGCNEEFKAHLRWKSQVAIDSKLAGTILALAEEFGMRKTFDRFHISWAKSRHIAHLCTHSGLVANIVDHEYTSGISVGVVAAVFVEMVDRQQASLPIVCNEGYILDD